MIPDRSRHLDPWPVIFLHSTHKAHWFFWVPFVTSMQLHSSNCLLAWGLPGSKINRNFWNEIVLYMARKWSRLLRWVFSYPWFGVWLTESHSQNFLSRMVFYLKFCLIPRNFDSMVLWWNEFHLQFSNFLSCRIIPFHFHFISFNSLTKEALNILSKSQIDIHCIPLTHRIIKM